MCSAATGPTPSYSTSCRGRCTRRRPYTEVCRTVVVSVTRAAPPGGGGSNSTPAGYFARVTAMRQLLLRFLAAGMTPDEVPPAKQVRRFSIPPQGEEHTLLTCWPSAGALPRRRLRHHLLPAGGSRHRAGGVRGGGFRGGGCGSGTQTPPPPKPDPPTRRLWLASVPSSGSTRRCTR